MKKLQTDVGLLKLSDKDMQKNVSWVIVRDLRFIGSEIADLSEVMSITACGEKPWLHMYRG